MSHEVETMAYAGEVPWHGLGTKVSEDLTVDEMMAKSGLDWTVSQHPMFAKVGDQEVPTDSVALIRDTDKKVLTVTTERWRPTQNHQAFEFFREFCEIGGAKMETAGSLRGGRNVWALAKLDNSFTVRGNDRTDGYLLFSLPHVIGQSIQVRTTSVRVVCNNTLTFSLNGSTQSEFRQSHVGDFNFDRAREVVEIANEQLGHQGKFAEELIKVKVDKLDAVKFFNDLISDESLDNAEAQGILDRLDEPGVKRSRVGQMTAAYMKGAGADTETAWGLLNGVTYWCDHMAGNTSDNRLQSSWFGWHERLKARTLLQLEQEYL